MRPNWLRAYLGVLISDERGVSLILALVVVGTMAILTAALATLVTSNQTAVGRDRQETLAFNAAEAALNYGIAAIVKTHDPSGAAAPGTTIGTEAAPVTSPAKTGTAYWWAVKTAITPATTPATYKWLIYAKGRSQDGHITRYLSTELPSIYQAGSIIPASTAWHYGLFVANPTGCVGPQGNADITISLYVNGNICVGSSGNISEPSGSTGGTLHVYATGTVQLSNGGKIGLPSRKIADITSSGCKDRNGTPCNNQSATNVYALQYNGIAPKLGKPVVPSGAYANGNWSSPACVTGSGYTTFDFDSNTTADRSLGTIGNSELFPSANYDCTVLNSSLTPVGRLAWNAATKTLTAQGLVYIDGSVSISSNTQVSYVTPTFNTEWGATAGIYVAGTVTTNGGSSFCGPGAIAGSGTCTPTTWNANSGVLFFTILNQGNAATAWQMNGNAVYQVAMYIDKGSFANSGNAFVVGPVITDDATIKGTSSITDVPNVPPQVAGGTTTTPGTTVWVPPRGTWRQCLGTGC